VYASAGGTRYHAAEDCRALRSGQDLSDWECWDDYCHHDHPQPRAIRETTAVEALGAGKMPCHVCLPGQTPTWYRSSSEDDYGHQPEWADVGTCRMPNCQCPGHEDREVCARCIITSYKSYWATCFDEHGNEHRIYGSWLTARQPVTWPCTTAVILGLAPREVTA
jgi:hypothetical protein